MKRSRLTFSCRLTVLVSLLFAPIAPAITPWTLTINTNNIVMVTDPAYGAVGDGVATNTAAIQTAINTAAAGTVTNGLIGGTVEIPPGIYLSGPLTLQSHVNLQVDGGAILRLLPFGKYPVTWHTNGSTNYFVANNFISGSSLSDIEISGTGAIDGQGLPWWPWAFTNGAVRPIMIRLSDCHNEMIRDLTLSNSPEFHISISGGSALNSTVQGVTIRAPSSSATPPSHNTDACDVDGANILVQNCNISVGDDDFTCGGGTADVLLTNNAYGSGHGVSIGSYTDGGVSNITVINCTFNGTDNGVRIKTDNNRGGLVQKIQYLNLSMTNVNFPIQVYAYYNEVGTPSAITPATAAGEPVAAVTSLTPFFRDITFSNITATTMSGYPAVLLWARPEAPATNLVFQRLNLSASQPFEIYNAQALIADSQITLPAGNPTYSLFNAQVAVSNAAPATSAVSFNGLTTNGYGNSFYLHDTTAWLVNSNALGAGPLTLDASTLTLSNALTLTPATVLNFVAGTNPATLTVTGDLTLGGTVDLSAGSGFDSGIFTLLNYQGTLRGTLPVLGTVPAGFHCTLDTNTPGQVRLTAISDSLMPPSAPVNLTAVGSNGYVALSWSPAASATSYVVQRATTSGGPYTTNTTVTGTNYFDSMVTPGTTYYYVVSAANLAGLSGASSEVSATPQMASSPFQTVTVFSDTFGSSTVNSSSPSLPGASSTSYEVISSKSWSPTPSIGQGHLKFGIASTTSGSVEVQALFAPVPITLVTPGDNLSLQISFTNTAGWLTSTGAMGCGLYLSGQNLPVAGGLNSTATTGSTANATGGAQTWLGYVGQLAYTGLGSQIMTRSAQVSGALHNNDQDLVTSGSGSASYTNNPPVTVGNLSTSPSVSLTVGSPYTEVLTILLGPGNTLAITNSLYAGTGTNGPLLSQFGGLAVGGTYLTNSFDALAIGWRETGNQASAIDLNRITVTASLQLLTTGFSPANNATNVCDDTPLGLDFDFAPVLHPTGAVKIYNATNPATPVDTIDLGLSVTNDPTYAANVQPYNIGGDTFTNFPVIITGNSAVIYPHHGVLTSNQTYFVTIDNGVFSAADGSGFAGIGGTNGWRFTTKPGGPASLTNLVVAQDGSGDFVTVQGAVDAVPAGNTRPTLISVANGEYREVVNIKAKPLLTLRGQTRSGVVLGYANNAHLQASTHYRMAFKVNANDIALDSLTLTNRTPVGGSQAEALMLESGVKRFLFNNGNLGSYQDTLLANGQTGAQAYFNNVLVTGQFDYLWGGGDCFFTNCELHTLPGVGGSGNGNLTASRTDNQVAGNWPGYLGLSSSNGFAFVNCRLTGAPGVTNVTLADANGTTNGVAAWIDCLIDTNVYRTPAAGVLNSQLLWEYGNSNLQGSASATFGLTQLGSSDARLLAAQSSSAWLNGWQPALWPDILTNPVSQTVSEGSPATFSVAATGIPDPSYQWLKNGTNLPGATNAVLLIPAASQDDAASYAVDVTTPAGAALSTTVSLSVIPPPPAAPSGLSAAPTNLLINLNWNPVIGATNYNLYRGSVDGGPYPTVFSGLTVTNFGDATVTNGMTYYYVVTAVGPGGESAPSAQMAAAPLPSAQPTGMVSQWTGHQLQLSWPSDHVGWRLQIQTNALNTGLGTNWYDVAGSAVTNQLTITIDPANGAVFLRLIYP